MTSASTATAPTPTAPAMGNQQDKPYQPSSPSAPTVDNGVDSGNDESSTPAANNAMGAEAEAAPVMMAETPPTLPEPQPPRKKRRINTHEEAIAAAAVAGAACRNDKPRSLKTHEEAMAAAMEGVTYLNDDHRALAGDTIADNVFLSLVHAFHEPLFTKEPISPALSIAYNERDEAAKERQMVRLQKKATLRELNQLKQDFWDKKRELLATNSRLKACSRKVGEWTRKVFDLELEEPNCAFNEKLHNLQAYVAQHGKIPEHIKKTKGTDEEKQLAAFISSMRSKVKRGHKSIVKYPHRLEALEKLGVHWESENEARFESMFAKLMAYKREHGTFRMPSLDLCKESGDKDLIALHNWVFSQVGSFRYQLKSKKVEAVKRFLDVGFSFEKWYGTNGHVFDREIPPFDAICKRYVENNGVMDEKDVEILRKAAEKSPKRGRGKKQQQQQRKNKKQKKEEKTEDEQEKKEDAKEVEEDGDKEAAVEGATTVDGTSETANATEGTAHEGTSTPTNAVDGATHDGTSATAGEVEDPVLDGTTAAVGDSTSAVVDGNVVGEKKVGNEVNAEKDVEVCPPSNRTVQQQQNEEEDCSPTPMKGVETTTIPINDDTAATSVAQATADTLEDVAVAPLPVQEEGANAPVVDEAREVVPPKMEEMTTTDPEVDGNAVQEGNDSVKAKDDIVAQV